MLSLVTVSPVITAFHSCCLLHHVFDQVNLWPAWVGFETAIFWQYSPGTVETQRLYPLHHGPEGRDRQQLWKAVITKDTVTRLSIPIWGCGKSPEEGLRWNLAETQWKKKQHKNYQDEDKKSAINKKLIPRLRSLISKWFQLKTNKWYIHNLGSVQENCNIMAEGFLFIYLAFRFC